MNLEQECALLVDMVTLVVVIVRVAAGIKGVGLALRDGRGGCDRAWEVTGRWG
jgi:hypothetical protein